jgi:hypothetical protein
MPKVICTLPNASEEINGVKFVSHKDGMISEEIKEDVAALFLSIPGYVAAGAKGGKKEKEQKDASPEATASETTETTAGPADSE